MINSPEKPAPVEEGPEEGLLKKPTRKGGERMYEDMRRFVGEQGPTGAVSHAGPQGPSGDTGDKGMPGPYCAQTELELLTHLIGELERASRRRQSPIAGGENLMTIVDAFVVDQAARALKNYDALLCQTLHQLVSPWFFNANRFK